MTVVVQPVENQPSGGATYLPGHSPATVTGRAFALGLVLAALLAGLNAWVETLFNVHFLGGVQMPFGAIFGLLLCLGLINGPLKGLRGRAPVLKERIKPLSPVELLTVYCMLLFAALISTPGTENFFLTTGATLSRRSAPHPDYVGWAAVGALVVYFLVVARSRFLWFPLHPLGFLVGSSYSVSRLWPSFLLGWLIKSLLLRYGGTETVVRARPFMIGLILGNVIAMVLWMTFGFWKGTQIPYWPA